MSESSIALESGWALFSALLLTPAIVGPNVLVMLLFFRFPRVRTPSNAILFCLAVADLLPGFWLPLYALSKVIGVSGGAKSDISLQALLATAEMATILFVAAAALDKAVSLARPLDYVQLVTGRRLIVLSVLAFLTAAAVGAFSAVWASIEARCCIVVSATVAAGFLITLCYAYVYSVASRHARDIRRVQSTVRAKEFGDTRHNTTIMRAPLPLEMPSMMLSPLPLNSHQPAPSAAAASQSSSLRSIIPETPKRSSKLSYSSTLALTVTVFLICRLPGIVYELTLIVNVSEEEQENGVSSENHYFDVLRELSRLPFLVSCAVNPWLYACHSQDLKQFMNRQLRRQFAWLIVAPRIIKSQRDMRATSTKPNHHRQLASLEVKKEVTATGGIGVGVGAQINLPIFKVVSPTSCATPRLEEDIETAFAGETKEENTASQKSAPGVLTTEKTKAEVIRTCPKNAVESRGFPTKARRTVVLVAKLPIITYWVDPRSKSHGERLATSV